MTEPIIQFKHVEKCFNDKVVIPDLSFTVNKGEFVTILGSSGSGKTTTLKMVNGLTKPNAGEILIDGQNINELDLVKLAYGLRCSTNWFISAYDNWSKYFSCS